MFALRAAAIGLAVAAFALPAALPARAETPKAGNLLVGFNAIVNGNFSTGHDVEGPVIVGGNLSGNGTFMNFGTPLGVTLGGFGSVNVYGSAGTSSFNANGLAVKVGAANAGSSFSGASSVTYGASLPATMAAVWNQMTALSAGLAALAPTSAAALPGANSNNAVLMATPTTVNGVANVAVIDIAASLLGSYTGVAVNLNGATTVVINVTGNFTAKPNFMNGAAWRNSVIWNFEDATSVALGAQGIQGTVLAPFANVSNGNPIDGALVAASFTGNGELHYKPFTGSTAFVTQVAGPQGGPTNVPEPASLALLATGAAGLAFARRRSATRATQD